MTDPQLQCYRILWLIALALACVALAAYAATR